MATLQTYLHLSSWTPSIANITLMEMTLYMTLMEVISALSLKKLEDLGWLKELKVLALQTFLEDFSKLHRHKVKRLTLLKPYSIVLKN